MIDRGVKVKLFDRRHIGVAKMRFLQFPEIKFKEWSQDGSWARKGLHSELAPNKPTCSFNGEDQVLRRRTHHRGLLVSAHNDCRQAWRGCHTATRCKCCPTCPVVVLNVVGRRNCPFHMALEQVGFHPRPGTAALSHQFPPQTARVQSGLSSEISHSFCSKSRRAKASEPRCKGSKDRPRA
jgi:hypothetical protein